MGGRIFHQTHWEPLMRMQQSVSEVKFDLQHTDGSKLPIVLNAVRRNELGRIVHDLAAFTVRDRDAYEREILTTGRRLQELATEANRLEELAKDRAQFAEQMMGIVSHDLRNPLAIVEMSAVGLESLGTTPQQKLALDRIFRATNRANRLIRELLDFTQARIGHGIAIQPARVNLPGVVQAAVDDLRHAFPGSTLLFVANADEFTCDADADRMTQIIGNLVANAVAYGATGRAITVGVYVDDDQYAIAVHNEGSPISASQQAGLFQPMTRGHQGPGGGRSVGLGLYIVSEVARAHGGSVAVQSTLESGTTFTVRIPRAV